MKLRAPEISSGDPSKRQGHKPLTPLQTGAVYGPVHSRRFGNSLGINPLPVSYKFCDFDCVYCQYGWTPEKGTGERLKRAEELLEESRRAFEFHRKAGTKVDCITIAGNGEPTIHPDFPKLVEGLAALRNEIFPFVKIGILTDSSQAWKPEIRSALEKLDERYMKLDGGNAAILQRINKPKGDFDFNRLIESLCGLKDIVIQSLFVQGSCDNTTPHEICDWTAQIKRIRPREVQVYSIDRGPADPDLRQVSAKELKKIAAICKNETGIKSIVFE